MERVTFCGAEKCISAKTNNPYYMLYFGTPILNKDGSGIHGMKARIDKETYNDFKDLPFGIEFNITYLGIVDQYKRYNIIIQKYNFDE